MAPSSPWEEVELFHASGDSFKPPQQPPQGTKLGEGWWKDEGHALMADPKQGERVLWAPHAIAVEDSMYMFYNTGNLQKDAAQTASWGKLHMASSSIDDGKNWKRNPLNPIFSDPGHARDSFVTKIGDLYHWYYTATVDEVDLRSAVKVRTSPNLTHWSAAKLVHSEVKGGYWGGNTESPQVIKREDVYYLFITLAMVEYRKTHVYWSTDPHHFPLDQFVTELPTHAPELIDAGDDGWFISDCGWDKKGLYIAPLKWENPKNNPKSKPSSDAKAGKAPMP